MMAYQALPYAGGLLDQEEATMRLLDVIHEEMSAGQSGGGKVLKASGSLAGRR